MNRCICGKGNGTRVRGAPLWTFRALPGIKGWRLHGWGETLTEFSINGEIPESLEKRQVSFAIVPSLRDKTSLSMLMLFLPCFNIPVNLKTRKFDKHVTIPVQKGSSLSLCSCKYEDLQGKKGFADVIILRIFLDYPGLSRSTQCNHKDLHRRLKEDQCQRMPSEESRGK